MIVAFVIRVERGSRSRPPHRSTQYLVLDGGASAYECEELSLALACHDSLNISLTRRKRSTHSFHQSRVSMTHGSSGSVSNMRTILLKKVLLSNFSSMGNHLSQELRATRAWRIFSSRVYIAINEHHTYLNGCIGDGPTCHRGKAVTHPLWRFCTLRVIPIC